MATVRQLADGKAVVLWRDSERTQHSATFDRERGPHGWRAFQGALQATSPAPARPQGWSKQGTRWVYLPAQAEAPQEAPEASAQTLGAYGTSYISSQRFRGADYYRVRSLASWSNHIASAAVGSVPVGTVTAGQLDEWQAALEGNLAPRTIRNLRTIMHQVIKGAIRDELRADNPLSAVVAVKGGRQHYSKPMKAAWLEAFETAARQVDEQLPMPGDSTYFQDAFTVLMGSPLRMGELRALQGSHIQGQRVTVAQAIKRAVVDGRECGQYAGTPKTDASARGFMTDADTAAVLARRAQLAAERGTVWLFPSQRGAIVQASVMGHRWHKMLELLRAAGVPIPPDHETPAGRTVAGITPHGLRRTYASWMIDAGVPIAQVQADMGHAHGSTTLDIYTDDLADEAAQLSAADTYAAKRKAARTRHLQAV